MRYGLEDKFRRAEGGEGTGYLRVSVEHPVDLFVGVEDGHRALLLICDREPPAPPPLDVISSHTGRREDGRWAFVVRIEKADLGGLFAYLAENLVEATGRETDCHKAAIRLVERLKWWQRLLSRGRTGILGDRELRGLVGELLFLRDFAIPALGPRAAVEGWVGQLDASRDFHFASVDVEVKAVGSDASTIRISSAEQLQRADAPIVLAKTVLESVSGDAQGAFSVLQIVNDVRLKCEPDDDVAAALSQRLWAAGYADRDEYGKIHFVAKPPVFYEVVRNFPVLVPAVLPHGIVQCTYQIEIASIARFSIADWSQAHD